MDWATLRPGRRAPPEGGRSRWRSWRKKGQALAPVVIEGRAIATTFWGKAWCDNLETYSDFETACRAAAATSRNGR